MGELLRGFSQLELLCCSASKKVLSYTLWEPREQKCFYLIWGLQLVEWRHSLELPGVHSAVAIPACFLLHDFANLAPLLQHVLKSQLRRAPCLHSSLQSLLLTPSQSQPAVLLCAALVKVKYPEPNEAPSALEPLLACRTRRLHRPHPLLAPSSSCAALHLSPCAIPSADCLPSAPSTSRQYPAPALSCELPAPCASYF